LSPTKTKLSADNQLQTELKIQKKRPSILAISTSLRSFAALMSDESDNRMKN